MSTTVATKSHLNHIVGWTIGSLRILQYVGALTTKNGRYACRCLGCGKALLVRRDCLRNGQTSCGCLNKRPKRHKPTYNSWRAMWARCTDPNHSAFHHYGGRGIQVYPPWKDYRVFEADMNKRPEGKTLDRIDPNGDYLPENCRWATVQQQRNNQR